MWVLVQNEVKMLRNNLLQIFGVVIVAVIVFARTAPQFVSAYFTVFPVVMGMTLPQMSFSQEERGRTFVFLRSLPVRPREIVAAKYFVSFLVTIVFWIMILVAMVALPDLKLTYSLASFVVAVSAILSAISYFQHFALGIKSAKIAMLTTFFAISAPVMLLGKNPKVQAWLISRTVQQFYFWADTFTGNIFALMLGAIIMLISFWFSADLFTRRDVSRLP